MQVFLRLNIPGESPSIISLDGLDSEDFSGIDEGKLEPKMFGYLIEALKSQTVQGGFVSLIAGQKISYSIMNKLKVIEIKKIYSMLPFQHRETGAMELKPVSVAGWCFNLSSLAGLVPVNEHNPLFGRTIKSLREKETGVITPEIVMKK